jgi:hypothetical protein
VFEGLALIDDVADLGLGRGIGVLLSFCVHWILPVVLEFDTYIYVSKHAAVCQRGERRFCPGFKPKGTLSRPVFRVDAA